jgi:NAD-dependent SIR2 family protein deacetylase
LNRYETGATKLYRDIFQLVHDKKYFVISTNVESQFEKAGFPSDKVFETQGDYCYIQCAKGCYNKVYYNESLIKQMLETTVDCKIPSALVPVCPVCGGDMDVHLRYNQYFVQDDNWYEQATLIRLNRDRPEGARENIDKTISFTEDMQKVVTEILS